MLHRVEELWLPACDPQLAAYLSCFKGRDWSLDLHLEFSTLPLRVFSHHLLDVGVTNPPTISRNHHYGSQVGRPKGTSCFPKVSPVVTDYPEPKQCAPNKKQMITGSQESTNGLIWQASWVGLGRLMWLTQTRHPTKITIQGLVKLIVIFLSDFIFCFCCVFCIEFLVTHSKYIVRGMLMNEVCVSRNCLYDPVQSLLWLLACAFRIGTGFGLLFLF